MAHDPLAWLLGLEQFGIKLGLHNIHAMLDALGRPERAYRTVHVAGTNGKGSVTAMVDAALLAAGHRSARYTSPHLIDITERMVIAGQAVSHRELVAVLSDIQGIVADLSSRRLLDVPTFFEVATAAAFELFRRGRAEIAVCEVGLGGRLDATNVVNPTVTAITSIGLDHQQHLGSTLREIALEKAGIIKNGVPVVVGPVPAEASSAITTTARANGAEVIEAARNVTIQTLAPTAAMGQRIALRTSHRDYGSLQLALAGSHQAENAAVAVCILEILDARGIRVPQEAVIAGLGHVRWPGRIDRRQMLDGRAILLDAAHNPDGAAALARYLRSRNERLPLVFAAMRDKDAGGMLRHLIPVSSAIVLTKPFQQRADDPARLAEIVKSIQPDGRVIVEPDVGAALKAAWALSPEIVVAGSIFLLGDVILAAERS